MNRRRCAHIGPITDPVVTGFGSCLNSWFLTWKDFALKMKHFLIVSWFVFRFQRRMNKVASCGPNQVFSQGLCYPKCRDDYSGRGPTCSQNCPTTGEFLNLGPLCQKKPFARGAGNVPYLSPCPPG